MKYACWGIITVLIVVAATACGCAGGPGAMPSPTGEPGMKTAASLFDTGNLKWYEYRVTTQGEDGKASVSDMRFDATTAVINGITVRDYRITMKTSDPEMVITMDTYYSMTTDEQIGSRMKMTSGDVTITDRDIEAIEGRYPSNGVAGAFESDSCPLTDLGTETVTVDGKTYICTRYSVGSAGEYGTAWVAPGVPLPVKIESKSATEGTSTWEMLGWG